MRNLDVNNKWNPPHYKCKACNDEIWSKYEGQYVTCGCGAISVDQTRHYSRYIGEYKNFVEVVNDRIA